MDSAHSSARRIGPSWKVLCGSLAILAFASSATFGQGELDNAAPDNAAPAAALEGGTRDAVSAAAPASAQAVTRFELEIELEDLLAAQDYSAAAARADSLIQLSEQEFGPDDTRFADALIRVARAQTLNEEFDPAEENSLLAVEIYRNIDGPLSDSLVEPYLALGDNYHANGDYGRAISAFDEARSVSRRVNGLLNPGQIEILDRLSNSAQSLDDMVQAEQYQRDALTLVERRNEPHSKEVVDAALRFGLWLRERNYFSTERLEYARAERSLNSHFGKRSQELVPLLRARANSFRTESLGSSLGIGALNIALEILEEIPDTLMLAQVYTDIGDWESAFNPRGSDGAAYLTAWAQLASLENGDPLREEWFGSGPAIFTLHGPRSRRLFSTAPDARTGHLVIRFTVDATGRTSDIVVTESDPPGFADDAIIRQIRLSRFRPTIQDGRVQSARRAFSAEFRYDADTDAD